MPSILPTRATIRPLPNKNLDSRCRDTRLPKPDPKNAGVQDHFERHTSGTREGHRRIRSELLRVVCRECTHSVGDRLPDDRFQG